MRGGSQQILRVRPAVGIRVLRVLYLVRSRSDELELACLAEFDQDDDGFGFEAYTGLGLVIERSLDSADVEVESHSVKLRLSNLKVQHSARNA